MFVKDTDRPGEDGQNPAGPGHPAEHGGPTNPDGDPSGAWPSGGTRGPDPDGDPRTRSERRSEGAAEPNSLI